MEDQNNNPSGSDASTVSEHVSEGQVHHSDQPTAPTQISSLAGNKLVKGRYESNPFVASAGGLVTILRTNPVSAMAANIVALLLIFTAGVIFAVFSIFLSQSRAGSILMIIVQIILFLSIVPVVVGANLAVAAASTEGLKLRTGDALKASFSKILPVTGLVVLLALGGVIGLALLLVPGIIFLVRSSLAPLIIFTEDAGPIKAIKRSFQLTKGHFFETLGASISGGLLCFYGLIAPVAAVAAVTARYQQFKSLPTDSSEKYEVHWLNYLVSIMALILVTIYTGFVVAAIGFGMKAAKDSSEGIHIPSDNSSLNNSYDQDFFNNYN